MSYGAKIFIGHFIVYIGYTLAGSIMFSPTPNWVAYFAYVLFGVVGVITLALAEDK